MNRPLLLLAALTFCCCITSLHGFNINACRCKSTTLRQVPPQMVRKIEVTPLSVHCRRTEIIITMRTGNKICINPEAKWFPGLLNTLQKKQASSTFQPPTASTPNF
ncbi:C-X-C motif chemokine 13-like isoform X2 [Archocentrus centrarchus]|uniref:C-X-C motif chemokine 13-like isoform X2 n=1 Tax=Archocentrus centrarchus TaxID=63155 RepID=UPI0011EA2F6A|nr:C-X-C motif chemokine 13-like isoform X2 [Archocentrus centrarchus]